MDACQAKEIIKILTKEWEIIGSGFLFKIIDFLDRNSNRKLSFLHEFEFSLIEDEPKIRLLHLYFWKPTLPIKIVKGIIRNREAALDFILKLENRKFNGHYDLSLLRSFFRYNRKTGIWPVQFGLEYQKNFQPKNKVYLSLGEKYFKRKKEFSWEEFCNHFILSPQKVDKSIKNRNLDAVAIDFLPNNKYFFKFYPRLRINQGYLYRLSPSLVTESIKTWYHFPGGLSFYEIPIKFSLPLALRRFIDENKLRIHYFCKENNRKSIYFR